MKKLLMGAVIVCAIMMSMTSCGETEQCWEISYETMGVSMTTYYYGTESEVDMYLEASSAIQDVVSKKAVNKNAADCLSSNSEF